MDQRLQERLAAVAGRYRALRLWRSLAIVWLIAAAVGAAVLWLPGALGTAVPLDVFTLGTLAIVVAAAVAVSAALSFRGASWAAHRLEQQFPDLDQRLITAITLRPSSPEGYGYLQRTVVEEALTHAQRRRWENAVSERQLSRAKWLNLPALLLLAVVLSGLWTQQGPALPVRDHVTADRSLSGGLRVAVDPGNTELERGSRLIVTARFTGTVPKEASLVVSGKQGVERIAMTRSMSDPLFGGQVLEVSEDLDYHVEFAGEQSDTYHVTVFEYPRLVRSDARLVYPEYTDLTEKLIEDTRRVAAVEGSELTWLCHLNKGVREAALVDEAGEEIPLALDGAAPHLYSATITLDESRRWTLRLVDADGRGNEYPPQLVATVMPNKPPEIKLALARDLRVSPLEEVPVEASFQDDFGLVQSGLTYDLAGESHDVVLASAEGPQRQSRHEASHILDFEAMEAEPDQLLAYHFWAEDLGPGGEVRRTASDMFFAEVRHFEEIFREGQQPPGGQGQQQQQQGQGQNAQQAEQLAELQKQIITGTWNVIRRETGSELSDTFVDDVTLLRDSQASAIEELESLAERVADDQSQAYIDDVRTRMQEAVEHLSSAVDGPGSEPLTPALSAEQAAYQGLLRLRAREHEVVRGQQQQQQGGGGQSGASARFQEQLEQLELNNNENRYETERQAQAPQENDAQSEMRQVLNRLRELAQRQEDLNEQLQQLQTALQQAQTEEEREEIERQLKRLRDQQEEMLRDTDELAQRMDESPNQSEMQESREQVQETRENVRQSAEALGEQNVSQALSAGTRAERQLEEMRDEFRRRTSNQFSEEMQEMREQARELDDEQQELGEQLADLEEQNRGSLRPDGNRQQLRDELEEQQQNLENLLERMQQTVQNAESTEPLLAESLYETIREARRQQLGERLEMTSELLRNGMDPQAQQLEQSAREGVTDLRQGIEQAAEEVLGDETEALQRALSELEQLSRELNQEIEREDPHGPSEEGDPPSDRLAERQRGAENGEPSDDQSQGSGEGEPSEQESGRRSDQQLDQEGRQGQSDQQQNDQQQPGREGQRSGQGESSNQQQSQSQEQQQSQGQQGQQGDQEAQEPSPSSSQSGEEGQPGQPSPEGGQGQSGQGGGGRGGEPQEPTDAPGEAPDAENRDAANPFDPQQPADVRGGGLRQSPQFDGGGLGGFSESLGSAPLTGDSFRDWSDRLREVEEIVGDPELRSEATRIRERARDIRRDLSRSGQPPQWPLVRQLVANPLEELKERVAEELLRRSAEKNALVPIDRDPVPDQFTEQVRRYYERLGSGD